MVDMLRSEIGPIQAMFGESASADPNIVLPVAFAVFFIMVFVAMRITLKDKGKSEMTKEELERDRAFADRQ
ncbi:MAG: hypothetical protein FWH32_00945 [Clostridiales bacterium]|nr:hypothetical protein [Clostridiales bacterium]